MPLKFYTTADGLPHNAINRIVRDSHGFLWFCTSDGLSRFDGYVFTNFGTDQGLPHGNVTDLLETREGQYWIATSGGLARFNPGGVPAGIPSKDSQAMLPTRPTFTMIAFEDADPRARSVTVLRQDKSGTIWSGTEKGLFRLADAAGQPIMRAVDIGIPHDYPDQALITDIVEDHDASLWIGSFSGLYRRWADGRSIRLTVRDGLPDYVIHSLMRDHLGRLWAGTRSGGFFQFAAGDARRPVLVLWRYKLRDLLPTAWVFQLLETSDHTLWIATNFGLLQFFPDADANSRRFSVYTTAQGLSYREITALNEDASGNLWLGTNTAGLMKLARNGFVSYGEEDGIASVNSIFEDQSGELCIKGAAVSKNIGGGNSYRYFGRFDGRQFRRFDLAALAGDPGWVMEHVTLRTRSGEWWVGTATGVFRFPALRNFSEIALAQPIAKYTAKDGLTGAQAFRMFEDSRGNIWVSTISSHGNGFARWDRATGGWTNLAGVAGLPSLAHDLPRSFAEDGKANVWIGFDGQLARYANGHFTWFGGKDGLPPGAILNMLVDHAGRLWLASARSGLIRSDDASGEHPAFIAYTKAEGMSSNRIEVITEDLFGRLYVGTGRALDRLNPQTGQVKHFTTADGLAPGLFRAAYRDRRDALWFGMTGGISKLVPEAGKSASAPPILLTGIALADLGHDLFPFGERSLALPNLAHDQPRLQIEFVGLDFTPGETLRYQYKLQGADWSAPSEQRAISFARLASGHYEFLVRAVNSEGVASAVPASVVFTVLPAVWQRWWFLTLVALGIAAAGWLAYRYRMAQVLEIANVRTRIATDLHDDIGSNLTKIAILSEVARQQLGTGNAPSGDDSLSAIAHISRESVASMSDIVWAINPQRDRLLDLVRRMRQHAEQVFTTRGVRLAFRAPGEEQDIRLRTDIRRDVFLIFKEAVNNAARHAECTEVEIDFRVENGCLSLAVRDNGAGFDESAIFNGEGLASMRRRAERLGGACEVRSDRGKSTLVHVTIAADAAGRTLRE